MNNPRNTGPESRLCSYTADSIYMRDRNLVTDLLGKASFVDVFLTQTFQRSFSAGEQILVNSVLIILMEHGMTPSAIAARLVYASSPEALQSGVAAGLLAVGSQFVGTTEQAAELLSRIVDAPDVSATAARIVADMRAARAAVPGFGHHLHRPDDPRASALLDLAERLRLAGSHCRALSVLAQAVDQAAGRHITINATGAVAAVLGDIGVPVRLMRGFAVLARAAGLIAHIAEEQAEPTGRFIWDLVEKATTPRDKGSAK